MDSPPATPHAERYQGCENANYTPVLGQVYIPTKAGPDQRFLKELSD